MKRSLYRLIRFIKLRAPWPVIWGELRLLGKKALGYGVIIEILVRFVRSKPYLDTGDERGRSK